MTVTMLMIWLAVCALTILAALADAACLTATANSAGFGELPPLQRSGQRVDDATGWFSA
jgi:hypothetical protein